MPGLQGVGIQFAPFFAGSGNDGDVAIGGGGLNLTNLRHYQNLTITDGTLQLSGVPLFVSGVLKLEGTAKIISNGGDGALGVAGTGAPTFLLGGSGAGGTGSAGGDNGGDAQLMPTLHGGLGGDSGGDGGAAGGFDGGQEGTPVWNATMFGLLADNLRDFTSLFNRQFSTAQPGYAYREIPAGGGGGGGGAASVTGVGGGGGAGGGVVYIYAETLWMTAASKIQANGGAGADGSGAATAGGGGGGAGGAVVIFTNNLLMETGAVIEALGGNGGAGDNGGDAGADGLDGNIVIWTPYGFSVFSGTTP